MMKFLLMVVVRMFMSFVGSTFDEDVVVVKDEESYNYIIENEDDYEPIMEKEFYYGEDEEFGFNFMSVECGNVEYFALSFSTNDYDFGLVTDANYNVVAYSYEGY